MKYLLLLVAFLATTANASAANITAKEIAISDILSNPSLHQGKPVIVQGVFLFSEPMRESFTIDQNGNAMEILYSDLSKQDKDRITALKQYTKVPMKVTGVVKQYANKAGLCYLIATTVKFDLDAKYSHAETVSYSDIASSPSKYIGKTVSMLGTLAYTEPARESLTLDQYGSMIEVFFSGIPTEKRSNFLSRTTGSKLQIVVTGVLQEYKNKAGVYFLTANTVELQN